MKNQPYRIFNFREWKSIYFNSLEEILKQPINTDYERYEQFEEIEIGNGCKNVGYNPI